MNHAKILIIILLLTVLTTTTALAENNYTILKKINNTTPTYTPLGEQGYDNLLNSTMGDDQDWESFDLEGIMAAIMSPGPDNFGPFFWIIVFGSVGTFIYIKTDSVIIPGAMFLIGSGLIGPMLLPEFASIIWGIVIIGFAALGYILFRSR